MNNSNETLKDKIISDIEISKQRVLDHLSIKDFSEVPLTAKCYALGDLEIKFLFSGENISLRDGYYYVALYYHKDYYPKNTENNKRIDQIELSKRKLKPEQNEFLLKFRKGLIEEYATYNLDGGEKYELAKKTCMLALYEKFKDDFNISEQFKDGKADWGKLVLSNNENNELAKKALKYEMLHLDEMSLSYNRHDNEKLDIFLYRYYVSKYREFLFEKDPHFFDEVPQITPKSGCYIATMAYGDYNHPQVILLRNFRDNSLAKSYWGREFIRLYYWLSPKIVARCKNNSLIVQTSRKILDNLIKLI